jgi:hypothetical protein
MTKGRLRSSRIATIRAANVVMAESLQTAFFDTRKKQH